MKPHKTNDNIYLGIFKPEYMKAFDDVISMYTRGKYFSTTLRGGDLFKTIDKVFPVFGLNFITFDITGEAYLQLSRWHDYETDLTSLYYDVDIEYFKQLIDIAIYENELYKINGRGSATVTEIKQQHNDVCMKLMTIKNAWNGFENECEKLGCPLNPFEQEQFKDIHHLYETYTLSCGELKDDDLKPFGYTSDTSYTLFIEQLLTNTMFKCNG